MLECPIVIDFEIGQLDISASRESLSYDERTKKNIEKRLSEIKPEMIAVVEEKKKDLKTLFDLQKLQQSVLRGGSLPSASGEGRGGSEPHLQGHEGQYHLAYPVFWTRTRPEKFKPKAWEGDFHHSCISPTMTHRTKGLYFKTSHRTRLDLDSDLLVILRDPGEKVKHEPKKMRKLYDDFAAKRENDLITAPQPSNYYRSTPVLMVDVEPNSQQYRKLMTLLGRPRPDQMNIVWSHDLPEPPEAAKTYSSRKPVSLKKINCGHALQDEEFDLEKVDYYFSLNRDDVEDKESDDYYKSVSALASCISAAKALGIIKSDAVIAGVPKSRKSTINRMENAKSIFDAFRDYFEENPLHHEEIVNHLFMSECTNGLGLEVTKWVSKHYDRSDAPGEVRTSAKDEFHISELVEGSPLREWIEAVEACVDYANSEEYLRMRRRLRVFALVSLVSMVAYRSEASRKYRRQEKMVKKLTDQRYPFLKYIINGVNYSNKTPVIDYINSVDTAPEICK
jgi:hypothetical protein